METINNVFNDTGLPGMVFTGNYDGYILLNYNSVFYDYEGSDKVFFSCLREALLRLEETGLNLYVNISPDEEHPYLPALPAGPKIPLRPVWIDFDKLNENTWNNPDSYDERDKRFADYYFNTDQFPVMFGNENKWAIYSDRVIELTLLGFKKEYLPAFASFFNHLKTLGYNSHEDFFKWHIHTISRDYKDLFIKEFSRNYPLYKL